MIGNIEYKPGLGKSDHLGLLFVFNCYTQFNKAHAFKKLFFFKGYYQSINTALQQRDWTKELLGLNLTQSWSYLAEIIIQLIEKFIPVSKARDEGSKNNPYVNRSCLDTIRNKHRKWLKYKYCMSRKEKSSETDSIKFKISSKTPRGKKDSTKRHHHRHHKQQPGEQQFPKKVVTG